MNMTKAIYWVLCSKYFTLACLYHSFLMIQKLSAIANATLYKVTMKSYTCLISFSFLTMCKMLFHLYLLTSIQEACINLFWEAWLWENTQIQVLNPKPIAPCWESFSDHFWQYQRLLASSVGVCHNPLCSGNATQPLVMSCFVHILQWGLAQAAGFANTMSDEPPRSHESSPHFRCKED